MKRGELVILMGGGPFAGKPRPAVVIQSDEFLLDSITVSPLTSDRLDGIMFRVHVEPSAQNGLERDSWIMVDKIITVRRRHIRRIVGRLGPEHMQRLNDAIILFLDLGSRPLLPRPALDA